MQWGAVAKGSVVSGWTRVTEKISEEIVEVSAARLALVCRGSSGWGGFTWCVGVQSTAEI